MPSGIERVLVRALSRDPGRRYSTAGEFLADLHRLEEGRVAAGAGDRIVVFDFENIGGNPADGWLGSGIAETLVTGLSRHPGLEVLPRAKTSKALADTP